MFGSILNLLAKIFATGRNNWTNDDDEFAHAFYSSYPLATSKNAQRLYSYGPIFFSKQFNKDGNNIVQKKCRKNWMYFLNDVANQRMSNNINW